MSTEVVGYSFQDFLSCRKYLFHMHYDKSTAREWEREKQREITVDFVLGTTIKMAILTKTASMIRVKIHLVDCRRRVVIP